LRNNGYRRAIDLPDDGITATVRARAFAVFERRRAANHEQKQVRAAAKAKADIEENIDGDSTP
jgi:hypothetical protein